MDETIKYHLSSLPPVVLVAIGTYLLQNSVEKSIEPILATSTDLIYLIVASMVLSSILVIFIFTRLKQVKIRFIYAVILSFLLADLSFNLIIQGTQNMLMYLISGILIIFIPIFFVVYAWGKNRVWIRNMGLVLASLAVAHELSSYLDIDAVLLLTFVFAVFDIYSVFYGPLSRIMGKPRRVKFIIPSDEQSKVLIGIFCMKGTPAFISSKYSILGIGDLLFFAVILFKAIEISTGVFLISSLLILLGSLCTLIMLRFLSPLPALPLPVAFVGIFLVLAT